MSCLEQPAPNEDDAIASTSAALTIVPHDLTTSVHADVCFRQGGGPITSGYANECMRSPSSGSIVEIYTCDGSTSQKWSMELDTTVRIMGKCLQPAGAATANLTKVELATCNGSETQKWQRWDTNQSPTGLVNTLSQRCLTAGSDNDRTQLEIRDCAPVTVADVQQFVAPTSPAPGPITAAGKCAALAGGNSASGTHVVLEDCDGTARQSFVFDAYDNTFSSLGKCMQVDATNGVAVGDCDGSAAQKWTPNPASGAIVSSQGFCLNLPEGNASEQQLLVKRCRGTAPAGQTWSIPLEDISPPHRRLIRDAIMNTWGAVLQLDLVNWQTCPTDLSSLNHPITIESGWDHGRFAGINRDALDHEISRGFIHSLAPAGLDVGWQDWNRGGAVHEFGHVLGFGHEQARYDNQGSYYCDAEGPLTGQLDFGPYDPESAMNYHSTPMPVNETNTGWSNLSLNDIWGARSAIPEGSSTPVYGAREFRRVIWNTGSGRQTDITQPATLLPGDAWTSVDGLVQLQFSSNGRLGVYRTDLYWNRTSTTPLPPLWEATNGTAVVTGTQASFSSSGGLQIMDGSTTVWSSTSGGPGAKLSIQRDGNIVIRNSNGATTWETNTAHRDALQGAVGLVPNATLMAGQSKTTSSGRFKLIMQNDGNLVVYDLGISRLGSTIIWSSNTANSQARMAKMMLDGTLALLTNSGTRVWTAPFGGRPAAFIALQEDGNLVAYEPAKFEVWNAAGSPNACLQGWRSTTAGQTCTSQTQYDKKQCSMHLDCYYNNGCSPSTCGSQDDICGVNVLGFGMAPKTIADQVYSSLGCPVVLPSATGSVGAFAPSFDSSPVRLWAGTTLNVGQSVQSGSGKSSLTMRSDGNLAFVVNGKTRWLSGTHSGANFQGGLTFGGDLQVRSSNGSVLYSSNTDMYMNTYVTFNDLGKLSIYRVVTNGADGLGFEF